MRGGAAGRGTDGEWNVDYGKKSPGSTEEGLLGDNLPLSMSVTEQTDWRMLSTWERRRAVLSRSGVLVPNDEAVNGVEFFENKRAEELSVVFTWVIVRLTSPHDVDIVRWAN